MSDLVQFAIKTNISLSEIINLYMCLFINNIYSVSALDVIILQGKNKIPIIK